MTSVWSGSDCFIWIFFCLGLNFACSPNLAVAIPKKQLLLSPNPPRHVWGDVWLPAPTNGPERLLFSQEVEKPAPESKTPRRDFESAVWICWSSVNPEVHPAGQCTGGGKTWQELYLMDLEFFPTYAFAAFDDRQQSWSTWQMDANGIITHLNFALVSSQSDYTWQCTRWMGGEERQLDHVVLDVGWDWPSKEIHIYSREKKGWEHVKPQWTHICYASTSKNSKNTSLKYAWSLQVGYVRLG